MTLHFTLSPDTETLDAAEQIVGVLRAVSGHGTVSGFAYRDADSAITLRTAWLGRTPGAADSIDFSVLVSGGVVTERVEDSDGRHHLSAEWRVHGASTMSKKEN